MKPVPECTDVQLMIYERSAQHHHQNSHLEELPDTTFKVLFLTKPEAFGMRIRIDDELQSGSASVDVALTFVWSEPVDVDTDLDSFARDVALPQVLAAASTVLVETARSCDAEARFHGISALPGLIEKVNNLKRPLSEGLFNDELTDSDEEGHENENRDEDASEQ